jgi:large repetitive protein
MEASKPAVRRKLIWLWAVALVIALVSGPLLSNGVSRSEDVASTDTTTETDPELATTTDGSGDPAPTGDGTAVTDSSGGAEVTATPTADPAPPVDGYHYTFVFEHTDGFTTEISGVSASNVARLDSAGGSDLAAPTGMDVHVSCSDSFPGGWGDKDGPDATLDPEWRVQSYEITKYKDGKVDKTCAGTPTADPTAAALPLLSEWAEYTFVFADGSIVTGSNQTGEAGYTGDKNRANLGLSEDVHVSCSDKFFLDKAPTDKNYGWGDKGAPVKGVDPYPVTSYSISRYKDGNLDKTCSGTAVTPTIDPVITPAVTGTPRIDVEKYVKVEGGSFVDADTATGPATPVASDVWFRFVVTNTGDLSLSNVTLTDTDFTIPAGSIPATMAPGESRTVEIGPFPAIYGQHANTATVTGETQVGTGSGNTGDGSQYTFIFANGTVISGSNQPGEAGYTGDKNEANLGLSETVHVSCSDDFNLDKSPSDPKYGWGEKGAPVRGVDPSPVASYTIVKYKGGKVDKTCGTGAAVSDSDPAHYLGEAADAPMPDVDIEKNVSVDGKATWQDADTPTGPAATAGEPVWFRLRVTNTGDTALSGITLTDTDFSTAGCTIPATLAAGASFSCDLGPFLPVLGQHENTATVTALPGSGGAFDPNNKIVYTFVLADGTMLSGKANTNDVNIGLSGTTHLSCSDKFGFEDSDPSNDGWGEKGSPKIGVDPYPVVWYHITKYKSDGTIDKTCGSEDLSDSDPAHYFGEPVPAPLPDIDLEKEVSVDGKATWQDADTVTGPATVAGEDVWFRFRVTNTGEMAVSGIKLTDTDFSTSSCVIPGSLAAGASFTCEIGPFAAVVGQHENIGNVTALPGNAGAFDPNNKYVYTFAFADGSVLSGKANSNEAQVGLSDTLHISCSDDFGFEDSDPSNDGWGEKGAPVQGVDPYPVTWYQITVFKSDGTIDKTCGIDPLADSDPAHYIATPPQPDIDLEKYVSVSNGPWFEADDPTGPEAMIGVDDVRFRFLVTNTGDVMLSDLTLTDTDFAIPAAQVPATLATGASFEIVIGPFQSVLGQHRNVATVTAEGPGASTAPHTYSGQPYQFTFLLADGSVLEGTATGNEAEVGLSDTIHISCSDDFGFDDSNPSNDGWGEKGSPVQGVDPYPIVSYLITKYKSNGTIDKTCGHGDITPEPQRLEVSDPAHYIGIPEPLGSIGDFVWSDTDRDGVQDGGESGIPGVTVRLLDGAGNVLATDTTDGDGLYLFDGLKMGTYQVQVVKPAGSFSFSPQNAGGDDTVDSDVDPTTGLTALIFLDRGENDPTWDAGIHPINPAIDIEKSTNGVDADTADEAPRVPAGDEVVWEYVVTNTGDTTLFNLRVSDDELGGICMITALNPGDSFTCEKRGTAEVGLYDNLGSVVATDRNGTEVSDDDPSHYFGYLVGIDLEKYVNSADADTPTGPYIEAGTSARFLFVVANTGTIPLVDVVVTDPDFPGLDCRFDVIFPNSAPATCEYDTVAVEGQHENTATVTGQPRLDGEDFGGPLTDSDPAHYWGWRGAVDIEKATNGEDADTGPGPYIAMGGDVEWTYVVTNTGNVGLRDLVVTDDEIGLICEIASLAVGASETCTASGIAGDFPYDNLGTVVGTPVRPDGTPLGTGPVTDEDPSHFTGYRAGIDIEKLVLGADADEPSGPVVEEGDIVRFTFVVVNTGTTDLVDVAVTDDVYGDICTIGDLPAFSGARLCFLEVPAEIGQHRNTADVVGQPVIGGAPVGDPVTDDDPGHYFGKGAVRLGDFVWVDTDGDGRQDLDEPGVPDVTVELLDSTGTVLRTDVTDANGKYLFDNVASGEYEIRFVLPAGFEFTTPNAGSNDAVDSDADTITGETGPITVVVGQDDDLTWDAGLIARSALGDFVWEDLDADGIQDPNEPGVPGVLVTLYDADGNVEATDTTDDQGLYLFDDLVPATWSIGFELPSGWKFTSQNVGGDDGVDSDADPTTGRTGDIVLPSGTEDLTWDAGLIRRVAGIDIRKQAEGFDSRTVVQGAEVTFEIVVTNTGEVDLVTVEVTDPLVPGCARDIGPLAVGESVTYECTHVAEDDLLNVATVTSEAPDTGQTPTDSDESEVLVLVPAIDLEKYTKAVTGVIGAITFGQPADPGFDADAAPGPMIPEGGQVRWTYVVENTGEVDLYQIAILDDVLGPVCVIPGPLAPGEFAYCELDGIAQAGQYENLGEVVASSETGRTVSDDDPSHYFGAAPSIDIEKATNGEDADVPTGPVVLVGDAVEWTYVVTNTGNVDLSNVSVTDDQGVTVDCPSDTLAVGASMTCTADGVAVAGQYANVGVAVGTPPVGDPVSDDDPSHYFGAAPSIDIEKATNGEDADAPTGPVVLVGDAVEWTYVVTNTGNVDLSNVAVTDDQGVTVDCPSDTLAVGASMTCTADGVAVAGQYENLGTATGTPPVGPDVTDDDPSHYFGAAPSIDIEKATNGEDADAPTGPVVLVGDAVEWTYVVTNTGNVDLSGVSVTDDQGVTVDCPSDTLAVGASMTCTADGVAVAGQYENLGTATGTPPVGDPVSDADPSHYFGAAPSIDIEKATNGEDADAPTGPVVLVGDAVEWTYVVTNTGNVDLSNVAVTDDQGVTVDCPSDTLAVGASMTCTADGVAVAGQYENLGTATGTPPVGPDVTDDDPSHYFGAAPSIDIEKATNGEDADVPTGPVVLVGDAVEWTYVVTNTGNVDLSGVSVTDDQGVTVDCPSDTLAVGASMTCTADGVAVAGQYANVGVAVGTPPVGPDVTDDDPSHYFGAAPSIDIEKATNGEDADAPTGPVVLVGDAVEWTYVVTNTGNVDLSNVAVTDDQGVTVDCPSDTLAVGASMTCTADGVAVAGQYENLGTATGTPPVGPDVTDDDPSHYFGAAPSIDIEKATNGADADLPEDAVLIPAGDPVEWTYVVTNTGNVDLSGVSVTDDVLGAITCPQDALAVGESMTCTASGVTAPGPYANLGTATGTPPVGPDVTDEDPSHYFGLQPGIDIEKLTNGEDADDPNQAPQISPDGDVTWSYLVTNTGNIPFFEAEISVVDDQGVVPELDPASDVDGDGILEPGEVWTYTATGTAEDLLTTTHTTVPGCDPDQTGFTRPAYRNIATVTVSGVTDSDPSHYCNPAAPSIDIAKQAEGPDSRDVVRGAAVTFTITVTNTGNVDLSNVTVTDPLAPDCDRVIGDLAVGASTSYDCTVDPVLIGFENVAFAEGFAPDGTRVTDEDPSTVVVLVPGIDIAKQVEGPDSRDVVRGADVTFEITVTNTGEVDLTNVTVSDPLAPECDRVIGGLLVGAVASYDCTVAAVTAGFENVATVTGDTPYEQVSDEDPSTVVVLVPGIDIAKQAEGPDSREVVAGADVTFTITVTNTGEVDLTNVTVSDPLAPDCDRVIGDLAAGASTSYECTVAGVSEGFTNVATVTGDTPYEQVDDEDPSTVLVPGVDIAKQAEGPDSRDVVRGADVTFEITVTNTGEVDLSNVTVSDPLAPDCDRVIGDLAAGASTSYECTVAAMSEGFTNVATVTGDTPAGNTVTDEDPSTVVVLVPGIDIAKQVEGPDSRDVVRGADVTFEITVTNTGEVDLTNVTVSDPLAPECDRVIGGLLVGAVASYDCTVAAVTAGFENVATVTGDTPYEQVSDEDPSTVVVLVPGIDIAKEAEGPDSREVVAGADVTFTITVTNTGEVDLTNVTVSDPLAPDCDRVIGDLAAGASTSYECTVAAVSEGFTNVATVTGDTPYEQVDDEDPSTVVVLTPSIDVEKATNGFDADTPAEAPYILVSEPITWTYVVTNDGEVDLTDVTVVDDQLDPADVTCPQDTLAIGESMTCTATGSAELVPNGYKNIATATGTTPIGTTVDDEDPSHYIGVRAGIVIEKSTNGEDADDPTGPRDPRG